jgi:uncharacterized protein (TIGR03382 family)
MPSLFFPEPSALGLAALGLLGLFRRRRLDAPPAANLFAHSRSHPAHRSMALIRNDSVKENGRVGRKIDSR